MVKNEDLSEMAYEAIKKMILRGELKPGTKLYQERLAETLGISRTPLNSALNKLEKEMLVEALPRRGFNVKELSLKELRDLYDVRLRLEPLGAREAAESRHPELEKRCTELLNEYADRSDALDPERFKERDHRFHNLIMEMSGNIFLSKMISSYNIISLGNLQLFMETKDFPKKTSDSHQEHQVILKAILARDPDKAESEMYRHIKSTRDRIASGLENESNGKA